VDFDLRNIPPGTVHRILGHANFATTMKLYGGLTAEALDKALIPPKTPLPKGGCCRTLSDEVHFRLLLYSRSF
jgi:hypothetical protein